MTYVSMSGTAGTDRSVNAATVPMAGYSLMATIGVNQRRNAVEVQNQSTDLLQMVRDDGAGAQQTTIMLVGAAVAGGQGGSWASNTFKGRIRVYAPTGNVAADQIGAYED